MEGLAEARGGEARGEKAEEREEEEEEEEEAVDFLCDFFCFLEDDVTTATDFAAALTTTTDFAAASLTIIDSLMPDPTEPSFSKMTVY